MYLLWSKIIVLQQELLQQLHYFNGQALFGMERITSWDIIHELLLFMTHEWVDMKRIDLVQETSKGELKVDDKRGQPKIWYVMRVQQAHWKLLRPMWLR